MKITKNHKIVKSIQGIVEKLKKPYKEKIGLIFSDKAIKLLVSKYNL